MLPVASLSSGHDVSANCDFCGIPKTVPHLCGCLLYGREREELAHALSPLDDRLFNIREHLGAWASIDQAGRFTKALLKFSEDLDAVL